MRALETELSRTFPAIKKQIDTLNEANIISVDKNDTKRAIRIHEDCLDNIKVFFLQNLQHELKQLFENNKNIIEKYYRWNRFWNNLDMDLIVLHCEDNNEIDKIKEKINDIFTNYFIDIVSVVFMSSSERDKRYRLADRFVLNIMKNIK